MSGLSSRQAYVRFRMSCKEHTEHMGKWASQPINVREPRSRLSQKSGVAGPSVTSELSTDAGRIPREQEEESANREQILQILMLLAHLPKTIWFFSFYRFLQVPVITSRIQVFVQRKDSRLANKLISMNVSAVLAPKSYRLTMEDVDIN